MKNIPDDLLDAIAEGEDHENARPENNTPSARAQRALATSPWTVVQGPVVVAMRGEPAALFATSHAMVVTRHVEAKRATRSDAQACVDALANAERYPVNVRRLHDWLDCFDGEIAVRVFGVPVNAERLHAALAAFPEVPDDATYGVANVRTVTRDGAAVDASILAIEHDGTTIGVIGLTTAEHCVAAWPIPTGVRE